MTEVDNTRVYRVIGGIFISSIKPLVTTPPTNLKETYGITHILSVQREPIPNYYLENYITHQIPIHDTTEEVIFPYLKESNEFICNCLFGKSFSDDELLIDKTSIKKLKHEKKILIHCNAGQSRSSTFIIAFLMKFYQMDYQVAKYAISRSKADVQPNKSFEIQLKLYKNLKCEDDMNVLIKIGIFKEYMMSIRFDPENIQDVDITNFVNDDTIYQDVNANATNENFDSNDSISELRCKRCRQTLANSTLFVPHDPPTDGGEEGKFNKELYFTKNAFKSRRVISREKASNTCTHYFLEPLNWMKPELTKGELEGKFACPKCDAKVGGYSWRGSRCSCGKWMIPAIHVQAAKVDKMLIKKVV